MLIYHVLFGYAVQSLMPWKVFPSDSKFITSLFNLLFNRNENRFITKCERPNWSRYLASVLHRTLKINCTRCNILICPHFPIHIKTYKNRIPEYAPEMCSPSLSLYCATRGGEGAYRSRTSVLYNPGASVYNCTRGLWNIVEVRMLHQALLVSIISLMYKLSEAWNSRCCDGRL